MAKRVRNDSSASVSHSEHLSLSLTSVKRPTPAASEDGDASPNSAMECFLPPHAPLSFSTYEAYDIHYQQTHTHRCTSCHKNFPSDHLLNLHIRENHDAIVMAQKARGDKIFNCFVEGCDRVCSTPQKRRMHLIDKHHFPREYDFFVVNDGVDRRSSMLVPKPKHHGGQPVTQVTDSSIPPSSTSTKQSTRIGEINQDKHESGANVAQSPSISKAFDQQDNSQPPKASKPVDDEMEEVTRSMSALKFVPQSVRFGRKRGRGLSKR